MFEIENNLLFLFAFMNDGSGSYSRGQICFYNKMFQMTLQANSFYKNFQQWK